ncbi:McrC family protein [Glacieibacterium frigidum]|uniref:Restriction endonuclease n=1 Tax=Glacieibacterium frigidum TaxID=2593303 RepID=A0A552UHM7_9SPHN|nr:restriction endonuclease [Glacieibacterium frigidum]TRW17724.1 restriction endonuclease [Glacieibacterium frigidum]
MKAWTVYEHRSLPFGQGDGEIPESVAGRLHAVASRTGLAGASGNGVLQFGRKALKARHIVGVVAAEGGMLEILPKIDMPGEDDDTSATAMGSVRRQLIHMLSVALDLKVDADTLTAIECQKHTLLEMLIRLFAAKLADALRAGMPRRYVSCADDLPALRGRLDVVRQFTVRAADPSRLACRFEALTPDIALNQIMKAAVARLTKLARASDTQRMLRELGFAYADIADVAPAALNWNGVVLDRTNARWRDLLALARLLLEGRFQTSSAGSEGGFALLFDMNRLFESYVAHLLRAALVGTDLHATTQGGRLFCLQHEGSGLFQTRPDILIKRGNAIVQIIDTKWKRTAPAISDRKRGVNQSDVYQMMAYGRLYGCGSLTLLYPHHGQLGDRPGILGRHTITGTSDILNTVTIDVSQIGIAREGARAIADRLIAGC